MMVDPWATKYKSLVSIIVRRLDSLRRQSHLGSTGNSRRREGCRLKDNIIL